MEEVTGNKFSNTDQQRKEKVIDVTNQDMNPEKTVTMDFENQDFLDQEIKASTGDASKNNRQQDTTKKRITLQEATEQIKQIESTASNQFTYDEFEEFADFLLTLIDTGISTGLRFWSGDSSSAAYEIPKGKMTTLKKQLTRILVKYQAKFSLEFMFVVTLCLMYSVPFFKAKEFRKALKNKGNEKIRKEKEVTKQEQKEEVKEPEVAQAEVIQDAVVDEVQPPPRKFQRPMKTKLRNRGGISK